MKGKLWPRLIVGVAALALVGGVVGFVFWERQPAEPAPNNVAETISADELGRAAQVTTFFGHMSVGNNILGGLKQLHEAKSVAQPEVLRIEPGDPTPQLSEGGTLVHALIGPNGEPEAKLANFDAALRAGLADQVDVALIKFCYLDVTKNTDVEALFQDYQAVLDALERDYPKVRFLHTTVPVTTPPSGIKANLKALLQGQDNPAREQYNALVRAAYPADRLLDVAAVEGTAPDGTRRPELYPGYSNDGSHLNATGSALVAADFVRLLGDGAGN